MSLLADRTDLTMPNTRTPAAMTIASQVRPVTLHARLERTTRLVLRAFLIALAAYGALAVSAQAAPTLSVDLTHSPASMPRNFEQLTYFVKVTNAASANPSAGDQVTCDPSASVWFNSPSFTYQWTRDGVSLGSANGGQTTVYTIQEGDAGHVLQCVVLGTNPGGAAASFSNVIAVSPLPATESPGWASTADPRPIVAGTANAQRTCTAPGTWTGNPAFAFQWLRNGLPISGATAATYAPQISATGTGATSLGSNQITEVVTTTGSFAIGERISGIAIPSGTTITDVSGTTLTLSANATATSASAALSAGLDAGTNLQCQVIGTNAGGAALAVSRNSVVPTPSPTAPINNNPTNRPTVNLPNVTSGVVTLEVELPAGLETRAFSVANSVGESGPELTCNAFEPSLGLSAKVVCSSSEPVGPQSSFRTVEVRTSIGADAPDPAIAIATVAGGGSAPATVTDFFEWDALLPFAITAFDARANGPSGADYTQAGGHPVSGEANFTFQNRRTPGWPASYVPIEYVKTVATDLPVGFVGNPRAAAERCDALEKILQDTVAVPTCPRSSVVGGITVETPAGGVFTSPIYATAPDPGVPAQFAFGIRFTSAIYTLTARLRQEGGYAISIDAPRAPTGDDGSIESAEVTLCSYGVNLVQGGPGHFPDEMVLDSCKQSTDPGADQIPLLTNPTQCSGEELATRMSVDTWQHPGRVRADGSPDLSDQAWHGATAKAPPVTDCHQVPFMPSVSVSPTSSAPDSASGIDAKIGVPTDGLLSPDGISQSHLKKAVVRLPEGVSVNPSGATGLQACSDDQLKLGTNDLTSCPDESKLGTVDITTPLIEEHLTGEVVLRTPKSTDPKSGDMLRLAIIAKSDERGLLVKLPGSATADPVSGRLIATFDENPQLPFSDLTVSLKGGRRGILATPQRCDTGPDEYRSVSSFTPWSQAHLPEGDQEPTVIAQDWTLDGDCSYDFDPGLQAGMSNAGAREGGAFSFEFTRPQGDQTLKGLTAELPTGLLASVKDVPLCKDAEAAAGNCPAASRIGLVDASAGSGDPFVLERKGEVFLTEGYKGGPYGLMVKVRAIAGPFRGQWELSPIVVRQKVDVDPTTAQVRAISDPFPTIWHGVPLRVRRVLVNVDRPDFMVNPSDCSGKQVKATLTSVEDTVADRSNPFQASDCAALPFKPKLALRLTGRKQVRTGRHPGVRAQVTQTGIGEAGIEKAVVRLPKSLALDPDNAQALCEFADGTKPDLENHCPKGSIVGRARAVSPLLNDPLVGNVYFVKNIRIDKKTGNEIRTLPMIIVALRGEIAINLVGESSTTRGGKLVNTFDEVPDAPISQFNLNIKGGKSGIIAVTRTRRAKINLCAGRHVAEADMDGQNGRRHDTNIRMKTPCTKRQTRKAKRAAKRAAQRARAARRG